MVEIWAMRSQELPNGSSPNFQRLVELCNGLINPAFILAIAQGTLPWQPIKVAKSAFFTKKSLLCCHARTYWNIGTPMGSLEAHSMWLHCVEYG